MNPFYNKWRHVLVDNAFCSPHLCHYLLERNTYITGTVRVHRKGMPSSFKRIRVPKGEREVRQQGQLMAMKYGDRKQVTFLSTFSDPRCVSYIYINWFGLLFENKSLVPIQMKIDQSFFLYCLSWFCLVRVHQV